MLRVIAAKVAGVNYDTANNSGKPETNDAPIKAGRTSPPALPPIHPLAFVGVAPLDPLGRRGFEQVLFLGEVLVGRVEREAARQIGGEIGEVFEGERRGGASRHLRVEKLARLLGGRWSKCS